MEDAIHILEVYLNTINKQLISMQYVFLKGIKKRDKLNCLSRFLFSFEMIILQQSFSHPIQLS